MTDPARYDHTQFEEMSWHDVRVHGLRIRQGDENGGELELDIDFIVEWLQPTETTFAFRVAPATLTFLNVFDLRIEVDYAAPGAGLTPFSIDGIERKAIPGTSTFNWTIALAWPDGAITFHASEFLQVLRSAPVLQDKQSLTPEERADLEAGGGGT